LTAPAQVRVMTLAEDEPLLNYAKAIANTEQARVS